MVARTPEPDEQFPNRGHHMSPARLDAVEQATSPGELARQDGEPEKDHQDPGSGEHQQKNPTDHQAEPDYGDAGPACHAGSR